MEMLCPWGDVNKVVDLRGQKLEVREKLYLGQQIWTGSQSIVAVHNKYKLNPRTLSDYKLKYGRKRRTCTKGGRPLCIDPEAQNVIVQCIKHNPTISETNVRQLTRAKHKECWNKWNTPGGTNKSYKRISHKSVVRYSALFRRKAAYSPTDPTATAALVSDVYSAATNCLIS
jgi:hypothetical protein